MKYALALLLALLPGLAQAADAILFEYEPSSTIYARVYTSHSAAVAAALSPGTSGNTRLYYVTDATIGAAGMTSAAAGNYPFTIFAGSPSTSASDTAIGFGVMRWNGTAAVDPLPFSTLPTTGQITSAIEALASYISMGANASTAATQSTAAATSSAAVQGKLPSNNAKMAGEGAIAKDLDDIEAGGGGGTTQPRVNFDPSPGFALQVPSRADGSYKASGVIRLNAGDVGSVYVFLDMKLLFGAKDYVETVGTPVVSGGSLIATAEGPRDTYAVVKLDGDATAGESRTVRVPVTMTSGTTVPVVFDVKVFSE